MDPRIVVNTVSSGEALTNLEDLEEDLEDLVDSAVKDSDLDFTVLEVTDSDSMDLEGITDSEVTGSEDITGSEDFQV